MTSGDQTASMIWYLLLIMLVGSSLLARRMPWRQAVMMLAGWIGIFGVIFLAFSYRSELAGIVNRVRSEVMGAPRQQVEGDLLRVRVADDGHYWVRGTVNGVEARFLIDSGASFTALSADLATRAGLDIDPMRVAMLDTANGPVEASRSSIDKLEIGPLRTSDLPVVVSPAFGKMNVVGMNFLSKLESWQVNDGELVLKP